MKKFTVLLILMLSLTGVKAQQLTIDECQRLARENYPSIHQFGFIEKSNQYSIENARTAYLPQISLSGQATYQSAVSEFPDQMKQLYTKSGIDMKGLSKDQYKIGVDVNQVIWDGGLTKSKNGITQSEGDVEKQQVEVELYGLKDRVNSLFFGILMIEAQEKQNLNTQEMLQTNCNKVQTMINNHTALQSDLDVMKAELVTTRQQYTQLVSACQSYRQMLGLFIHKDMSNIELQMPTAQTEETQTVNRPELQLFDTQQKSLTAKRKAILAALNPQIGAFAQGYYGKPGMNMFKDMVENKFSLNAMIGIRLRWNLSGLYTKKRDLSNIDIASQRIETQRQTFLFNTMLTTTKQQNAIGEMKKILSDDDEIIRLRQSVRKTTESKLSNGIINTSDLVRDITNENNARIAKASHEIELLNRIYQLKNTINQ